MNNSEILRKAKKIRKERGSMRQHRWRRAISKADADILQKARKIEGK